MTFDVLYQYVSDVFHDLKLRCCLKFGNCHSSEVFLVLLFLKKSFLVICHDFLSLLHSHFLGRGALRDIQKTAAKETTTFYDPYSNSMTFQTWKMKL